MPPPVGCLVPWLALGDARELERMKKSNVGFGRDVSFLVVTYDLSDFAYLIITFCHSKQL